MKITIEEYIKKNNIVCERVPITIGIFGSRGKTTVIHFLNQYLTKLGKKVVYFSSINSTIINVSYDTSLGDFNTRYFIAEKDFNKRVHDALSVSPDFIIFEVHEDPCLNCIFERFLFDIRVVTSVDGQLNSHDGMYFRDCLTKFLENNKGKGTNIVDLFLPSIEWEDVLLEFPNEKIVRYSHIYDDSFIISRGRKIPKYKPNILVNNISKFIFEISVDSKIYRYNVNLSPFFASMNLMAVIAVICELNLFDAEVFQLFIDNIEFIPGRGEIYQITDKSSVIIDLNGAEFIKYAKETTSYDLIREQEFVNMMGYEPKSFMKLPDRFIILTNYISQEFNNFTNIPSIPDDIQKRILEDSVKTINNSSADFVVLTRIDYGDSNIIDADNYLKSNITIPYLYEPDRREAIKKAMSSLADNEILVISNRGDRDGNWVSEKNEPYTDLEVVNEWFEENM